MKTSLALFSLLLGVLPAVAQRENPPASIDEYLGSGKTILIVECLDAGPVDIIGRSRIRVRILLVVKGKETLREITIVSRRGMHPGDRYLVRTKSEATIEGNYFTVESPASAVPVSENEKIEELSKLSPRIIALRTMNLRIYRLENQLSGLNYELEELNAARREK